MIDFLSSFRPSDPIKYINHGDYRKKFDYAVWKLNLFVCSDVKLPSTGRYHVKCIECTLDQWFGWHKPPCSSCWIETSRSASSRRVDCCTQGTCYRQTRTERRSWQEIDSQNEGQWLGWISSICPEERSSACSSESTAETMRFIAPPALAITKAIADFILLDGHPASIVEGEGIQQLMKLAEPRYVCPSRTYFEHVSSDAALSKISVMLEFCIMHVFVDVYPCTVPQSQAASETGSAWLLSLLFASPNQSEFDPALSQPLPSYCVHNGHVDRTWSWVLHLSDCSLVRFTLAIAACSVRHLPLHGSTHWWKFGGVDQASIALQRPLRMLDRTWFCFDHGDCFFLSFVAAPWCWSADSWSWCWRDESSTTERDPWLSMLWSWTRSYRPCWPWLPYFRFDFHESVQLGVDHPILPQPLSQVARRSGREESEWSSRLHLFPTVCVQLEVWIDSSVRPVLPMQFVRTRWQSKYGMLNSLLANKESVRRMCASDDECCRALHDQDLSDTEWQIVEVRVSRSRHFRKSSLLLFCLLDRNPYPFSNALLKSRSCSRVRTMCCHRHIGVLLWMLKSRWLHMQKILHRFQRFEQRCMLIISAREWLWSSPFPMVCMSWWPCSIQGTAVSFLCILLSCIHASCLLCL